MNMSLLFSMNWIIISTPAFKPSMESASYRTILGIFIVDSYVFLSMEHICDINGIIQWMRIQLAHFLVTSVNWLYQKFIVQDNSHLQWRREGRIWIFLLRSHTCPSKISHGIFEIICIHIQDIPLLIPSCCIISGYHRLLL